MIYASIIFYYTKCNIKKIILFVWIYFKYIYETPIIMIM